MSNCHDEFQDFLKELNLRDGEEEKLTTSRDSLRDRIAAYFKKKGLVLPIHRWQGSFALKTQNRPISEDFDLDDGVYLQHFSDTDTPSVQDVFRLILDAVAGHTSEDPVCKDTCVRVIYKPEKTHSSQQPVLAHHVDLAIYREKEDGTKLYAHLKDGWTDSDQAGLIDWFKDEVKKDEQLRTIIRLLKGWSDNQGKTPKMPSGFHFTVFAAECFCAVNGRDDTSLVETAEAMHSRFEGVIKGLQEPIKRPVTPNEDIFAKYDSTRKQHLLSQLKTLASEGRRAINEGDHVKACQIWQNLFGNRFTVPPASSGKSKSSSWSQPATIGHSGRSG